MMGMLTLKDIENSQAKPGFDNENKSNNIYIIILFNIFILNQKKTKNSHLTA